jgi:hypothetical protein
MNPCWWLAFLFALAAQAGNANPQSSILIHPLHRLKLLFVTMASAFDITQATEVVTLEEKVSSSFVEKKYCADVVRLVKMLLPPTDDSKRAGMSYFIELYC